MDLLDPGPADAVLEVGGGPGVSASVICQRLTTGRLLAVDRSAVAVRRTCARNPEHLAAGRLTVEQCALHELIVPAHSFDQALALDVNLFWTTDATRELEVLRQALRPGGTLHVLYGVGPSAADQVLEAVSAGLEAHGFTGLRTVRADAGNGICATSPG